MASPPVLLDPPCIVILQGRLKSLTRLSIRIREATNEQDMYKICDWISVCSIFHNFLIKEGQDMGGEPYLRHRGTRPHGNPLEEDVERLQDGRQFRASLMPHLEGWTRS